MCHFFILNGVCSLRPACLTSPRLDPSASPCLNPGLSRLDPSASHFLTPGLPRLPRSTFPPPATPHLPQPCRSYRALLRSHKAVFYFLDKPCPGSCAPHAVIGSAIHCCWAGTGHACTELPEFWQSFHLHIRTRNLIRSTLMKSTWCH